jgi:hypothetical protein
MPKKASEISKTVSAAIAVRKESVKEKEKEKVARKTIER